MTMNEQLNAEKADDDTAQVLWEAIASGATLKEIHGITDSTMEGLYAHAYKFYQLGRSKDAEVVFRFLHLYDAYNADYALGLAATYQQQKLYQEAINTYTAAFVLSKNDYRPLLYAGQCNLYLKNTEQAKEQFNAIAESIGAPAPLVAQAKAYLAALNSPNTTPATAEAAPPEIKEDSHGN